jgi:phosphoserine phosphatase RsbU/P
MFRDWECAVGEVQMEADDILCLYTDGITEATNESGKEFGETGLLEVLRGNRDLEASAILEKVARAVEQFRSGEQEEDLTMVVACAR